MQEEDVAAVEAVKEKSSYKQKMTYFQYVGFVGSFLVI